MSKEDAIRTLEERESKRKLAEAERRGSVIAGIVSTRPNSYSTLLEENNEKKTKRVSLLLKPSVFNQFKAICDKHNLSVNEAINRLIEDLVESNID